MKWINLLVHQRFLYNNNKNVNKWKQTILFNIYINIFFNFYIKNQKMGITYLYLVLLIYYLLSFC